MDNRCVVSGLRPRFRLDLPRVERPVTLVALPLTAAVYPYLRSRRWSARPPRTLRSAVSLRVTLGASFRVLQRIFSAPRLSRPPLPSIALSSFRSPDRC